jgi:polar amino acid transport system permease protein
MLSLATDLVPDFLVKYRIALLSGVLVSLKFLAWGVGFGFIAGLLLAIAQLSRLAILRAPVVAVVELIRNTPLLVQLLWIHFAMPTFTGIGSSPERSAAIGIALSGACYFSEIVRGGIQSVPVGQREAAAALGLSSWCLWTRILLPQAVIDTLPASANTVLSFFKATSILSVIAVPELMMTATRISARTGDPIGVLTAMTLIYIAIGILLTLLLNRLERALASRSMR